MYIDTKNFNLYTSYTDSRIESSVFEVDELIAPIISILNKKNYITNYCCSGHVEPLKISKTIESVHDNCYIKFDKDIVFDNYPQGFDIYEIDSHITIRRTYDFYNKSYMDKLIEIMGAMTVLYNWAESLK